MRRNTSSQNLKNKWIKKFDDNTMKMNLFNENSLLKVIELHEVNEKIKGIWNLFYCFRDINRNHVYQRHRLIVWSGLKFRDLSKMYQIHYEIKFNEYAYVEYTRR